VFPASLSQALKSLEDTGLSVMYLVSSGPSTEVPAYSKGSADACFIRPVVAEHAALVLTPSSPHIFIK
jgi:hypothetical protein